MSEEVGRTLVAQTDDALAAVADEIPALRRGMAAYLRGGKRLRARLLTVVASHGPAPKTPDAVRYATFIELIHAGGLCHDDVVDHSTTRRARPSIGHLYGEGVAAAGGLYLMARAFDHIASDGRQVRRWVGEAATRVARGQAREMTDLYRETVQEGEYLARISDKTGALFELAVRLGAVAGGFNAEDEGNLTRYAARIGSAFQLADDLRDIVGGPMLGREPGTDIREGVYTLPVILTLSGDMERREELRCRLRELRWSKNPRSVLACCDLMIENGAIAATARVVHRVVREAQQLATLFKDPLKAMLDSYAGDIGYGLPASMGC